MLSSRHAVLLLVGFLLFFVGCRTSSSNVHDTWPIVDALPESAPKDLKKPASGTVLQMGSDGYFYAVGDVSGANEGSPFYARFAGKWPLEDLPRPPLASGHLVKMFDGAALVSLDYKFPDAEVNGLLVSWQTAPMKEELGKGIAPVTALNPSPEADVLLSIGDELGVQPGDIYAIMSPVKEGGATEVQITRRVKGICLVNKVDDGQTLCRLWRGSSMVPGITPVRVGDIGVFWNIRSATHRDWHPFRLRK